jgi:hypothetical protein
MPHREKEKHWQKLRRRRRSCGNADIEAWLSNDQHTTKVSQKEKMQLNVTF